MNGRIPESNEPRAGNDPDGAKPDLPSAAYGEELLHQAVEAQIAALGLEPGKPLLISDADEVLVRFMTGLEAYLAENGLYIELTSFALNGNIRSRKTDEPLPIEEVRQHLGQFFATRTEHLEPVAGAAETLAALSDRMQIVVLSNIPLRDRDARRRGLARHGIDYPLIANVGRKGAAVREIARPLEAPIFFLDDLPGNLASVARQAAHVRRVHYVADPRLAKLVGEAEDSHFRARDWEEIRRFVEDHLDREGG